MLTMPNRRASDESEPSPFGAIIDVNSMRQFNDCHGFFAGDILIKRLAEILVSVGLNAYHTGGDEFACKGDSYEEPDQKLSRANILLINWPNCPKKLRADFCFGICEGKVVDISPSGVVEVQTGVMQNDGTWNAHERLHFLHFDNNGNGRDAEGTIECGPWYIVRGQ
jgi:GGDEF domain-containing protein